MSRSSNTPAIALAGISAGAVVGFLYAAAGAIGYFRTGATANAMIDARGPVTIGAAAGLGIAILVVAVRALADRRGLSAKAAATISAAIVLIPVIWLGTQWMYVRTFRGHPGLLEWTVLAVITVLTIASITWVATEPSRRSAMIMLAFAAVLAGCTVLVPAVAGGDDARPDAVIILVDALRADALGVAGYSRDTTPNLDALAADGAWFSRAVTQATFTKASIASLFTALVPHRHGVYEGNLADTSDRITSDVLRTDLPTFASRLSSAGYTTVAFIQQVHLASYMGFGRGFASYNEGQGRLPDINDRFLEWLDRHAGVRPFVAYVHYIDLHDPYQPQPPWDTYFGDGPNPYARCPTTSWKTCLDGINAGEIVLTPADLDRFRQLYDGLVRSIDAEIGRVLDRLRALDRYDDTLIVVTSDHGDGFMEHGFISHSTVAYDELALVPLIVKLPKNRNRGTRVDAQVRLIDLHPTLVDILGADPTPGIDGASLVPLIRGDADEPARLAFSEFDSGLAVRSNEAKLLFGLDGRRECYDLGTDPGERNSLWPDCPDVIAEFERQARQALGSRLSLEREPKVEVDPRSIEELRSLGYVQ